MCIGKTQDQQSHCNLVYCNVDVHGQELCSWAETGRDTVSITNDRHAGDSCGYRALAILGAKAA